MTVTKLRKGFTALELLLVIAIFAFLGIAALQALDRLFPKTPTVVGSNKITTMMLQIAQNPIAIDAAGNSTTAGTVLVLLNAPPPAPGAAPKQPTMGVTRTINFFVFPHHPSGTVTVAPATGLTGTTGVVSYTLTTTQYEGAATILAIDAATGEQIATTVVIR